MAPITEFETYILRSFRTAKHRAFARSILGAAPRGKFRVGPITVTSDGYMIGSVCGRSAFLGPVASVQGVLLKVRSSCGHEAFRKAVGATLEAVNLDYRPEAQKALLALLEA